MTGYSCNFKNALAIGRMRLYNYIEKTGGIKKAYGYIG